MKQPQSVNILIKIKNINSFKTSIAPPPLYHVVIDHEKIENGAEFLLTKKDLHNHYSNDEQPFSLRTSTSCLLF